MQIKKAKVKNAKEIQEVLSERCRVTSDRAGPTNHELYVQRIGDASMLNSQCRDFAKDCLKRLGIVQPQSQYEKNEKAFDRFTLTADELERKNLAMWKQLSKKAQKVALTTHGSDELGTLTNSREHLRMNDSVINVEQPLINVEE